MLEILKELVTATKELRSATGGGIVREGDPSVDQDKVERYHDALEGAAEHLRELEKKTSPHLELEQAMICKMKPYCFAYSPKCGKCGDPAAIRSTRNSTLVGIEIMDLVFQCDRCKLRWDMAAYRTKKRLVREKVS